MIIEKYTDPAGFIRVLWRTASGQDVWFKFKFDPSLVQLQAEEVKWSALTEFNDTPPVVFNILEDKETLIKIIFQIRNNPALTLTQYNNYLATLPWNEAAVIRFFIYVIGRELAKRGEVSLAGLTEAQFLAAVRNFIVNTPLKKLARLILGSNDAIG